ncbi:GNAT family N-acetyltransferase [Streptomyces longispororuber]|uniref:GNAT family N-acetyltransferase n=1 Tax=Streptomyces longispororuber TaxID=68230 RepID=UPI0033E43A91
MAAIPRRTAARRPRRTVAPPGCRYLVTARAVAGWSRGSGVRARLLVAGDRPVGYGELWPDEAEDEVELARIIVAPRERGRGWGARRVQAPSGSGSSSRSSSSNSSGVGGLSARRAWSSSPS